MAAISGLALHAVVTDATAHELHVTALEARLLMLEDELAAQADAVELLQKKHARPLTTCSKPLLGMTKLLNRRNNCHGR